MNASTITLLFLLFAIIMFVWEKIPLAVTAMTVCIGLVVTGVLDAKTAFHGFVDPNVILFVAMFIVGGALFETGMANRIGALVTRFAKTERQLIIAIMTITGIMSGFLSNTGTAAILIPVVVGIAAKAGFARPRLLMPLVFAAAMGGNLSLIGAPGNLIAQGILEQDTGLKFGFFEYAKIGLPILVAGILYFVLIGYRLLPDADRSGGDSIYNTTADYGHVPKWKQNLSLFILIATLLAMILEDKIGIKLYISGCIGALALSDTLRPEAKAMVERLHAMDVRTVLLTGDNKEAAAYFASQVGIDEVHAGLLPEDKVAYVRKLQEKGRKVLMIGDGVNDAPALKSADVSAAMGAMGSDIAVEAADVALMRDDVGEVPYLKRLANATATTIKLSITLSMCINFAAIVLSLMQKLNPTTGALVHNAGSCFVVLIAALLYDRKFD